MNVKTFGRKMQEKAEDASWKIEMLTRGVKVIINETQEKGRQNYWAEQRKLYRKGIES